MKSISLALVSILSISAFPLLAANPNIGVATTIGTISVNQSTVSGNTDLADGSHLQTTMAPSEIHLTGGADVRLATRSSGTFYADHVALEQGALRVGSFNGLTVNAGQLQIGSDDASSQAIIRMNKKTIEVASVGGSVNVMDSGMLTRVAAGTRMSFQQSGGTPDQTTTTGAAASNRMPSDKKTILWIVGITCAAGLIVGLTAAAQGKSPF